MKNIYSFFICFILIFSVGCDDDNNDNGLPQDKSITLSQERLSVLYLESTEEIALSANIDWEVSNSSDWIDVSPLSGKASDEQQILTLSIARNDSYDSRSTQIVIKSIDGQTADTLTIMGNNRLRPCGLVNDDHHPSGPKRRKSGTGL